MLTYHKRRSCVCPPTHAELDVPSAAAMTGSWPSSVDRQAPPRLGVVSDDKHCATIRSGLQQRKQDPNERLRQRLLRSVRVTDEQVGRATGKVLSHQAETAPLLDRRRRQLFQDIHLRILHRTPPSSVITVTVWRASVRDNRASEQLVAPANLCDQLRWRVGSSTMKRAPAAGPSSIRTVPQWVLVTSATIARPRPAPPVSRARAPSSLVNRSKIRFRPAGGMPGPSSVTVSVSRSDRVVRANSTVHQHPHVDQRRRSNPRCRRADFRARLR